MFLAESVFSAGKIGVDDGARTHDRRNHNPELYQLSYVHHWLNRFLARHFNCFTRRGIPVIMQLAIIPADRQVRVGSSQRPAGLDSTAISKMPKWASLILARPAGLEPATPGLEGRCSIRLSYGRSIDPLCRFRFGRGGGIRTPDPLLPKQLRYQTAPHPDRYGIRPL